MKTESKDTLSEGHKIGLRNMLTQYGWSEVCHHLAIIAALEEFENQNKIEAEILHDTATILRGLSQHTERLP